MERSLSNLQYSFFLYVIYSMQSSLLSNVDLRTPKIIEFIRFQRHDFLSQINILYNIGIILLGLLPKFVLVLNNFEISVQTYQWK